MSDVQDYLSKIIRMKIKVMINYLKNNRNNITSLYNKNRIHVCIIELNASTIILMLRESFEADVEELKLTHIKNQNTE